VRAGCTWVAAALVAVAALAPPAAASSGERARFTYDVPVDPGSPWPMFRRDQRNTGLSPIRARAAP
jgi:hypothetical protein